MDTAEAEATEVVVVVGAAEEAAGAAAVVADGSLAVAEEAVCRKTLLQFKKLLQLQYELPRVLLFLDIIITVMQFSKINFDRNVLFFVFFTSYSRKTVEERNYFNRIRRITQCTPFAKLVSARR